jgi:hypothetical protein
MTAAALWFGVGSFQGDAATFQFSWLGPAMIIVSGIVLAFLAGSRLSPVASLIGGLAFTALGLTPVLEQGVGLRLLPELGWLPPELTTGFQIVTFSGWSLFIGVALLIVSVFPSRWRSGSEPVVYSPSYGGSEPSPYLPQHGPEDATRPLWRE